jgi:hypothetical protein
MPEALSKRRNSFWFDKAVYARVDEREIQVNSQGGVRL